MTSMPSRSAAMRPDVVAGGEVERATFVEGLGVDLGMRGMRTGGVRQLVVSSRHACGDRAVGDVPARAVMVFVVRLESVR